MARNNRNRSSAARRNQQAGKGFIDRNRDNVPDIDPLERDKLADQYKSAIGVIYSVPEIQPLFEQAVKEQWSPQKFSAAVQETEWFRNNNQYARQAWAQETIGGADWQVRLDEGKTAVQQAASQIGSSLTEPEIDALARRYVYEGWYDSTRTNMLAKALSEKISYVPDERGRSRLVGESGSLEDSLRDMARANGISYSDSWYLAAARSVASGLTDANYWDREVRETAASTWNAYSDQIRNGQNVYDLASPYINTMAQEFEVDRSTISLDDPYIRSALTSTDDKGTPVPLNLWEFTKKLRKDPRWENTQKAQNEITSVAGRVMQMFGLMGG